ncbi:hypothetical protein EW145_g7263 [Phellinidium pouzarii]|uniref:Major facilitator superfamily (MFS) profile domain-containing protein n=1 Tax=Phellinidium pouzarii TaxID=167371 RepID=A0A4V3XAX6_9AGAM|nr:hypothetical protein EW145_g7263 [Phellinidium pouzarii]
MGPSQSERALHTSRSRSRPPPYLSQGQDALLLPQDSITEEAVELLHEFVHPHHRNDIQVAEDLLLEEGSSPDDDEDWEAMQKRPWYKRPSPWWLLCTMPFSAMAGAACAAPRVEIYTLLACLEHKPEYTVGSQLGNSSISLYGVDDVFSSELEGAYDFPNTELRSSIIDFKSSHAVHGDSAIPNDNTETINKCATDPIVGAATAKLIASLTTTMGILSCLTTAFWGSLSDRFGRLPVMGISILGLLLTLISTLSSSIFFSKRLPGGYWFLLLGPLIEGSLGGFTSGVAAVHAYTADCTSPEKRSRIFSLSLGLLFIGMSLGPSIGGLFIHFTHQTLSVFYFATSIHLLYAILLWTILPESLPPRSMAANRARRARLAEEAQQTEAASVSSGWCVMAVLRLKKVFVFLSPLSIFAPETVDADGYSGKTRRDWSLTLVAGSYGFSALVFASYQYVFQYAAAAFGWTSEEMGYWLSLVGGSRALYLTLVLPLIIKFFNRPKPAIQLPVEPSEPLNATSSTPMSLAAIEHPHRQHTQTTSAKLAPHTPSFDLALARGSLVLEVVCYSLIPLAPNVYSFSACSMLAAWGRRLQPRCAGARAGTVRAPTCHARRGGDRSPLRRDERRASDVIFGPSMYGLTYMKTVATYPKTIFWVSSCCLTVSLIFICLVRLPRPASGHTEDVEGSADAHVDRESTLIDAVGADTEEQIRGRNPVKVSVEPLTE